MEQGTDAVCASYTPVMEFRSQALAVREASRQLATLTRGEKDRALRAMADAAAVPVNASSRFVDGGQFGFGAEIGISTQKLHARGPMGLAELTSTKYIVNGDGQVRT